MRTITVWLLILCGLAGADVVTVISPSCCNGLPVVQPGPMNGMGLLGATATASFSGQFVSSLVPEICGSSCAATMTRVTSAAGVGYASGAASGAKMSLQTGGNNEAIFLGARRVSAGVWSVLLQDGAAIPAGTLQGVLVEGAATNLMPYSNVLSSWTNSGLTKTQDTIGLDGGTTAWTLTDSGGAFAYTYNSLSLTASQQYTFSIYIKKTVSALSVYPSVYVTYSTKAYGMNMDTTNGTAINWVTYSGLTVLSSTSTVTSANEDYWRYTLTATPDSTSTWLHVVAPANTNVYGTAGDGIAALTGSAVVTNAQVETGTASSYISNDGAGTTTRNATALTYPDVAGSSITLIITPQSLGGIRYYWSRYVDANNSTSILHDGTNMICRKRVSGINYDATKATTLAISTAVKVGCRFSTGTGVDLWVNGVKGSGNANLTAQQFGASFAVGQDGNSGNYAYSAHKNLKIYTSALPDSAMQGATQ